MKYIDKQNNEPQSVTDWKNLANQEWQPKWEYLQNPQKRDLKESLLEDQGYICCYCQKRIENNHKTEIEHIIPRESCVTEAEKLVYTNLIVSCDGNQRNENTSLSKKDRHCNNYRKDKPLYIDLLDNDCENLIYYDVKGGIYAVNNDIHITESINNLNLSILRKTREKYIEGFLPTDAPETTTMSDIIRLLDYFYIKHNLDNDGIFKFPEYAEVMTNILNSLRH